MASQKNSVNPEEIKSFEALAHEWWNENGAFKMLHHLNPPRLQFIKNHICQAFNKDPQHLKCFKGIEVLDVGCGGGLLSEPLARLGANVMAIDAGRDNIEAAKSHARRHHLTINYRTMSVERLAQQKKRFDVVISMEVVEHVADLESFLTSCCKLLKPGGLLFLSTLNRTLKSYMLAIVGAEYVLRWIPKGTHQWQKFLRPSELYHSLSQQGVLVSDIKGLVFKPFSGTWGLSDNPSVNYLLCGEKE
jgi:2-polyprenyl-6-hydroxyphenyl methylase/3-demethylubiquinone-9 3-methyltransferase